MDYLNTYSQLFAKGYNKFGSNKLNIEHTLNFIKTNPVENMIDISSGAGVLVKIISEQHPKIKITCTDLSNFNNLNFNFIELDLSKEKDFEKIVNNKYDLLTCLDVLEHLEKNMIPYVLENFSKISNNVILSIANHSDIQNDVELHTIIENLEYWIPEIEKFFSIVELKTHEFIQPDDSINYLYLITLKRKN